MSQFTPLLEFIPALSPRFASPRHLAPIGDLFQRIARGESVRAVTNVPPRMGKTELILHGGAWLLAQNPALQLGYASHGQRIAEKKSRRMRELSRRAGVPLSADSKSRSDWRTGEEEGGCWATSPAGAVTGEGFDVLILDDLTPGRAAAESGASRDRINEWLIADALTRLEPGGSCILNQTRWHPDDPAGRALALGWEHVNLQALDADERSLWPERWSAESLKATREMMGGPDGYEWQSLYMGSPRGRGARVFGDVHFYDELPDLSTAEISIGLDFAYSTRTSADWSVAVVMAYLAGVYYVLNVIRVHEEPRAFRTRIQLIRETYKQAIACAYAAATEQGGIEFVRDGGVPIDGRVATVDKFSRAIPVVAAWNTGKVKLPRTAPWLDAFVSEVCGFTGVKDRHDDQVDALAAAYDRVRKTESAFIMDDEFLTAMGLPLASAGNLPREANDEFLERAEFNDPLTYDRRWDLPGRGFG